MLIAAIPALDYAAKHLHQLQKHFGGQTATAYVDAKYNSGNVGAKGNFLSHLAKVSYIAKDGSIQTAELSLDWQTYNKATNGAEIEIVYNPQRPSQAYAIVGQGMPRSWLLPLTITTALVVITVIERYHRILFMKIN